MPKVKDLVWPGSKRMLLELGIRRLLSFCTANDLPRPAVHVIRKEDWYFDACAFYRPDDEFNRFMDKPSMLAKGYGTGICICIEHCAHPATDAAGRNWSWPASKTDRTPYGVIAHELGHHLDWLAGDRKGKYWSEFGANMRKASGEEPLTGYCPNDAEWFAEMARLYITNPDLLRYIRPATYALLSQKWKPAGVQDWNWQVGANCPARVVRSLLNMGAS